MAEETANDSGTKGAPGNNELIILSVERSGTNFFCECLGAFKDVSRFFEFFGANVFGLNANPDMHERLGNILGMKADDQENPELVAELKDKPVRSLKVFSRVSKQIGKKLLTLKIFPGQIRFGALKLLLVGENKHVVFITRSRIDCYISFQKALMTSKWQNSDTTNLKPKIDVNDFLAWAKRTNEWYNRCEKHLKENSVPYQILSYEADIDCPKDQLIEKQALILKGFGIEMDPPTMQAKEIFTRQDRTTDPFDKVENGAEFKAELEKLGRLKFALGKPLMN